MKTFEGNTDKQPYEVWNPSDGHGPIKLASCDFRDGQQSLIATRMRTEDMVPILARMDEIGFECIEMWGGATFDSCLRYLKEDPWDRIRTFKQYVKKTPLRMLLRGQNLLGYTPYPDDVVERFVTAAASAGMDIFLIFDGLNDIRNCEAAAKAAIKAGKLVEGNIQFTSSPVHNIQSFVQTALDYVNIGATAVHLEDMGGMIDPVTAGKTVAAVKAAVKVPVHYHAHCLGGMTDITYWEVAKAGVDVLDVDVSAFALGTSQPAAESIIAALRNTPRDTGLDYEKLIEINLYLKGIREKYKEFSSKLVGVDINVVRHQVPGGMYSNLEYQLRSMNADDRMEEVLDEVVRVRKDLGYPPLGTPFSQMCGAQATNNVLTGERYKMMIKEIRAYVQGKYGKAPGPVSEELKKKILAEGETPITCRPADLIEPGYERLKAEVAGLARTDEDVLTYAMFPIEGLNFLKVKYGSK
ncbi:MAG: pyruvate carboxylase subunit B [Pseudomonadota bacterium]